MSIQLHNLRALCSQCNCNLLATLQGCHKFVTTLKFLYGYSPYNKELLLVLKSFAFLIRPAAIFHYYVIQITPSDAESHEEQDGSKQKCVGETMAKLWLDLHQGVMKNMEEK